MTGDILDVNFPEKNRSLAENFCRNPNSDIGGPWCFTTSVEVEWGYCNVPVCERYIEENKEFPLQELMGCRYTTMGETYNGTISKPGRGYEPCMRWDSNDQYPDESFPEQSRKAAQNFCRNPNKDVGGPWCWHSNQDMMYCNVPFCDDSLVGCSGWWIEEYHGTVSQTRSGKTCQRWDMTFPHFFASIHDDETFPEGSKKAAQNFCRKLGELVPWCYTTDLFTVWEYCDVPMCEEPINAINDDGLGIFLPEVRYKYDGDPFALLIKTIKQDMSDFIFALNLDNSTTGTLFEASDVIERCRFSDEPCEQK
ncbi:unnamed protein product [Cyprideis torosa]|uniref:Uncharacterized protein n=1 Tax=Cyprideis torosa TaxID=163714 RepID=A0A7R8ZPG1_9CRUS|nr:unnamed protein product [Cyprideis torosa]CAG0898798.1 unnamed protein product [Cyprideis torosa]